MELIHWLKEVVQSISGLPRWHNGKESASNAGEARDSGLIPGLGRFPGEGSGNPPQYSCLENPVDRWSLQAVVRRGTKNWTWLKQLSTQACRTRLEMQKVSNEHKTVVNTSPEDEVTQEMGGEGPRTKPWRREICQQTRGSENKEEGKIAGL